MYAQQNRLLASGHRVDTRKKHITPTVILTNADWRDIEHLAKLHGFTFDHQAYQRLKTLYLGAASLD